jgi:hypothetical protein
MALRVVADFPAVSITPAVQNIAAGPGQGLAFTPAEISPTFGSGTFGFGTTVVAAQIVAGPPTIERVWTPVDDAVSSWAAKSTQSSVWTQSTTPSGTWNG